MQSPKAEAYYWKPKFYINLPICVLLTQPAAVDFHTPEVRSGRRWFEWGLRIWRTLSKDHRSASGTFALGLRSQQRWLIRRLGWRRETEVEEG